MRLLLPLQLAAATVWLPRRCPRCRGYLDDVPPSGMENLAVMIGVNVYSCHTCLLRMYSWRVPKKEQEMSN